VKLNVIEDSLLVIFFIYFFYLCVIDIKQRIIKNKQLLPILFLSIAHIIISIVLQEPYLFINCILVMGFNLIILFLFMFKIIGGADFKLMFFIFILYNPINKNGAIPIIDIYEFLLFLFITFYCLFLGNYLYNYFLFKLNSSKLDNIFDSEHKNKLIFGKFIQLEKVSINEITLLLQNPQKREKTEFLLLNINRIYFFNYSNVAFLPYIFTILVLIYFL
jgi:Flp pilus assembly protein protease CpaA